MEEYNRIQSPHNFHNVQDVTQNYLTYKETGKCDSFSRERRSIKSHLKTTEMLGIASKDFKLVIITMLNDLKENMLAINEKTKS